MKKLFLLFATLLLPLCALAADYALVTSADDLTEGEYLIVSGSYAMGTTQNSNNRAAVSVTVKNKVISNPADNVAVLQLTKSGDTGYWSIYCTNGDSKGYLYASSSSANQLKTATDASSNTNWDISVTSSSTTITCKGQYTRNLLQKNSNSALFACYSSNQAAVTLYKKVVSEEETTYPILSLEGITGTSFVDKANVVLSGSDADATYYYYIGSEAKTDYEGYTEYTEPFEITSTCTVSAYAQAGSKDNSIINTATFTCKTATPEIEPAENPFKGESTTVSITGKGSIYYTTDGSDPTTESTLYAGELTITEDTTIKAIAKDGDKEVSDIAELKVTKYAPGYTIVFKSNSGGDSSDSFDCTKSGFNIDNVVESGAEYIDKVETTSYMYAGKSGYGIKLGSKSNAGEFKFTLTDAGKCKNATITVTAAQYSGETVDITVNNTKQSITSSDFSAYTYKFTGALNSIDIISTKRCYIKEIKVSYSELADDESAMPVISPTSQEFVGELTITISPADGVEKADIYYAVNNDSFTNSDEYATEEYKYTGEFKITENSTVKAFAKEEGKSYSDIIPETYTGKTAMPVITASDELPFKGESTTVTMTGDGDIYYTTDGTTPTEKSTKYSDSEPITITETTTFKAIAKGGTKTISDVTVQRIEKYETSYTIAFAQPTSTTESQISAANFVKSGIDSDSQKYVSSCSTATYAYTVGSKQSSGVRLGQGSNAGKLVLNLSDEGKKFATKIVVTAARYNTGTASTLNVNSIGAKTLNTTGEYWEYSYPISGVQLLSTITLNTSNYAFIKEIKVVYDENAAIPEVSDLKSFKELENSSLAKITNPVTVVYVNDKYMYVKDDTAPMLLYNTSGFEQGYVSGETLNGIVAVRDSYYLNPQGDVSDYTNYLPAHVDGEYTAVTPLETTVTTIKEEITPNTYVTLKSQAITTDSDGKYYYIGEGTDASRSSTAVQLYNKYGVDATIDTSKKYDIIGFTMLYNDIDELAYTELKEVVETPEVVELVAPVADPSEGTFEGSVTVTLSFAESNKNLDTQRYCIVYTIDDNVSDMITDSTGTVEITGEGEHTLKAAVCDSDDEYKLGPEATFTYTITKIADKESEYISFTGIDENGVMETGKEAVTVTITGITIPENDYSTYALYSTDGTDPFANSGTISSDQWVSLYDKNSFDVTISSDCMLWVSLVQYSTDWQTLNLISEARKSIKMKYPEVSNLGDALSDDKEGETYTYTGTLRVTFRNGNDIYGYDSTSGKYIYLIADENTAPKDILTGGSISNFNYSYMDDNGVATLLLESAPTTITAPTENDILPFSDVTSLKNVTPSTLVRMYVKVSEYNTTYMYVTPVDGTERIKITNDFVSLDAQTTMKRMANDSFSWATNLPWPAETDLPEEFYISGIVGLSGTDKEVYVTNMSASKDALTGVESLTDDDSEMVDVYNFSGVMIRKGVSRTEAVRNLPAGLYIIGGKKVILK